MKRIVRVGAIVCLLACIVLVVWWDHEQAGFSCYTVDEDRNRQTAFWSEAQGAWYLCVPSAQSIGDTVLHYTGNVREVSAGILDAVGQTVRQGFRESGDELVLTARDGKTYRVVIMQSQLPSVEITLSGTTLDRIHADKDVSWDKTSVRITTPDGQGDLTVAGGAEIKGRGNSSWDNYEKKGYQLTFDKDTAVLDMNPARKWVLIANACDDSMLRNQLAYQTARQMDMDFVPQMRYVDLWINGDYRGTYLIGERVEITPQRLNLTDGMAALLEQDETLTPEGNPAIWQGEKYWLFNDRLQRHFALKDLAGGKDSRTEAAMAGFDASLSALMDYLYSTPSGAVALDELNTLLDVDSAIRYFLLNEYVLNKEAYVASFFWYQDGPGDVLHLGPVWDFDTCMGNDGTSYAETWGENHILFQYLMAAPAVYDRTQTLLSAYRDLLDGMAQRAEELEKEISRSAQMNYLRWEVLGKPAQKKGGTDFAPTFAGAVENLVQWLRNRAACFRIDRPVVAAAEVTRDCRGMALSFSGGEDCGSVTFAVWSEENGQDDLQGYSAVRDETGVWRCNVDLTQHSSRGIYRIHVLGDDCQSVIGVGTAYVETARTPCEILAGEAPGGTELLVTVLGAEDCADLELAVWTEENGQDDLKWYTASRNADGSWTCAVPLEEHPGEGPCLIHAYTGAYTQYLTGTVVEEIPGGA